MKVGGVPRGVKFGLDRFTLGAPSAARMSATLVGTSAAAGLRAAPAMRAGVMATSVTAGLRAPAMRAAVSMRAGGVPRAAVSTKAGGVPRGVKFGLDRFTLG